MALPMPMALPAANLQLKMKNAGRGLKFSRIQRQRKWGVWHQTETETWENLRST
jgi:hypothetical protein